MPTNKHQRILVTAGEPAGIGPDLCLQLAGPQQDVEIIVIADQQLLQQRAQQLGLSLTITAIDPCQPVTTTQAQQLKVWHTPLLDTCTTGVLNTNNAAYVLRTLDMACDACLAGHAHAMVTAPVHKAVINDAGMPFSGHTEYLQQRCQSDKVVMMLACAAMRVALVTTHLPLAQVAKAITPQTLQQVIRILHQELQQRFAKADPKIYVCGLNPHAGEGGHLGREELDIIIPTLQQLRHEGINLIGPLPADTLFNNSNLKQADCVLAMYHDQGLPVLKYAGFGSAVNITLGLPIIRTSVDHGTALALAGTGQASASSLLEAVRQAHLMHL
ncbi:MAG: 4-hydroxythreonine-4-phosphate dehydrogenase PdxA [Gammaproteobacteria bacterium]|nr:4-hydroxythreonine-4-phosphate dehydrogenase PdxA [Gammaproteobacteria bacterium]